MGTFGGPYNKDYSILGFILGSPYLGKLPYCFQFKSDLKKQLRKSFSLPIQSARFN